MSAPTKKRRWRIINVFKERASVEATFKDIKPCNCTHGETCQQGQIVAANNKDLIAGILAALIPVAMTIGYVYILWYLIRYSLDSTELRIRMLGLTVRTVHISDIRTVRIH